MSKQLKNYKVAILVADGFEESELAQPKRALENAGFVAHIISPAQTMVRSWSHADWSHPYTIDVTLDDACPEDYGSLLLPGGMMNPDTLRLYPSAIDFISKIAQAGKPIAAICHGPWTLIDANAVKGKTVTSWPSIRKDLENAGAHWVDKEVVVDGLLVTSRKPDDIPAFNEAMIALFAQHKKS